MKGQGLGCQIYEQDKRRGYSRAGLRKLYRELQERSRGMQSSVEQLIRSPFLIQSENPCVIDSDPETVESRVFVECIGYQYGLRNVANKRLSIVVCEMERRE